MKKAAQLTYVVEYWFELWQAKNDTCLFGFYQQKVFPC
jgi:hypothetical protein